MLLGLMLSAALLLVAPAGCGCATDLHGGAELHPVFSHVHPADLADRDVAATAAPRLQGGHGTTLGLALDASLVSERLAESDQLEPTGRLLGEDGQGARANPARTPPDPPPELA